MWSLLWRKAGMLLLVTLALSASQFAPVSRGRILWMQQAPSGDYVLLTYEKDNYYHYIDTTYQTYEGVATSRNMLPGEPSGIAVSGCGNLVTVAVTMKDSDTVYASQVEVPVSINCGYSNTTYIPLVVSGIPGG